MTYKPGDIIVVPFPFTDLPVRKKRPALVLSHSSYTEDTGHIVVTMVTSAARSEWQTDVRITDLKAAGLPSASVVRWKVFTLPTEIVIRTTGQLHPSDWADVQVAREAVI